MLENWCFEKDVLKRMSGHYQTKEPLPDNLLDKLIQAKNANTGIALQTKVKFSGVSWPLTCIPFPGLMNRRQIFFALYDMLLHTNQHSYAVPRHPDTGHPDTGKLWAQLRKELNWIDQPPNTNPATSFGHLMGG